jgi:hypothetical protein
MTEHPDEARLWADHHQDWSRFLTGLWSGAGEAFRALNAIQYDAPWKGRRRASRSR